MTQPRELMAWSDRELRSVEATIRPAWGAWLTAWGWPGAKDEAAACECATTEDEGVSPHVWESMDPPGAGAWLSGWHTVETRLLANLCGPGMTRPSALAARMVQRAHADLASRLAPAMPGFEPNGAELPDDQFRPWSGGVIVRLTQRGMQLRLLLAGSRVRCIVPRPSPASREPLDHDGLIASALSSSSQATAELQPSLMDLGALADLAVGDVLRLDHALDRPLSIHLNGQHVCHAYLGRRGITKAVALAP